MKCSPIVIVMGPSGCGKSAVGGALAERLGVPFLEGDDFHSTANVEKMASGKPLTDEDRWPWLRLMAKKLAEQSEQGAVLACSALKEAYQRVLVQDCEIEPNIVFLEVSKDELHRRMKTREHFMPVKLLDSQLEILEVPESAILVNGEETVDKIVSQIANEISQN